MTKKELIEFLMNPEIPDDAVVLLEGFDDVTVMVQYASHDTKTNDIILHSNLV